MTLPASSSLCRCASDPVQGITRLAVQNFRSYGAFACDIEAKHIIITGPNGIGKTNLLEAISLLSPGRGLRNASPLEWRKNNSDGAVGIALGLDEDMLTLRHNKGDKRRTIQFRNASITSQNNLAELLSIVWLTPQMDGLFLDEAAARRKFVDRLIYAAHPEHAGHLQRYEQALRQRNKFLKERAPDSMIRAWHPILVAEGVAIAAARLEKTQQLNEAFARMDTPFPLPLLTWRGTVEQCLSESTALGTEELYALQLETNLDQDRMLGQTRLGIHRSDVSTIHRTKNIPVSQCSTGEQKALLISMVLAHAEWLKQLEPERPVILLLDEVTAHFDPKRREQLFEWASSLPVQIWMTGTEENDFAVLKETQKIAL